MPGKKLAKRSSFFRKLYKFTRTKRLWCRKNSTRITPIKGVSSDIIDEVLIESEIDWYEMAENLLRKKFPNYNEQQTPKIKQKIWQYMLSHGFRSNEFADLIGKNQSEWD